MTAFRETASSSGVKNLRGKRKKLSYKEKVYLFLILPGFVMMILFKYVPMFGIVMAFENYSPVKGFFASPWVGLKNFNMLFRLPNFQQVLGNTLFLAVWNIVLHLVIPLLFAIMLNEVRSARLKKAIQTIVYLPHFLSWVVLAFTFKQIFSNRGIVNQVIHALSGNSVSFFGNGKWFRFILIMTNQWKEFGWSAIIYLSAMLAIDSNLYEAAAIDGATRPQRVWHITIPAIMPIIILQLTLSLGTVLDANFDQVFNMYNTLVYDSADIIDTYVYRLGMISLKYSMSSAAGLFKSAIGFFLICISYFLADRLTGYRIF